MPTSFSVFLKVGLELSRRHLFEMSSGFGNIHEKMVHCRARALGLVFSELGTGLCP